MAANADCKIQISYGKDGLLLNIYAQDSIEAEKLLTNVQDMATLIESVGSSLGRSNPNQAGSGAISYAKKALGVTSVASTNNAGEEQLTDKNGAVWIYGKADAPDCINGKMVFASGTSKAGKPYKGWFDPMKGPKPMRKPEGYTPVDPIFLK
jgi:hypothetical protein